MFMQNIMIAAQARGIDSCAQASWMEYPGVVGRELDLSHHDIIICGMALGYADLDAIENTLQSERVAVKDFVIKHE
jgi:nitroreductase